MVGASNATAIINEAAVFPAVPTFVTPVKYSVPGVALCLPSLVVLNLIGCVWFVESSWFNM